VASLKNTPLQKAESKNWALTQSAFGHLLSWLDEGGDSAGEKYLEMRRRLVSYFDRKNCLAPEELTDETLNRVARRLEEEGSITNTPPAQYCYIVAKYVFLEYYRKTERSQVSFDDLSRSGRVALDPATASDVEESRTGKERMLGCLDHCLENLDADNRDLIIQYYRGEQRSKIENRRAAAERLGITMNALSIRACRVRERLEACVRKCSNN
jgi:DNA-directed RNA polymerase specialized sigma24 family protein